MHTDTRCRGCGNPLPSGALGGLCPVYLLREGLAGDEPAWSETGGSGGPKHGPAGPGVLATLTEILAPGEVPRGLLRDSDVIGEQSPLVQPCSPEMPTAGDRAGRPRLAPKTLDILTHHRGLVCV